MPQDHLPEWLREERLDVGRRIRAAREWANLSQERLAEWTGVDRMTIVRIELGQTSPRLDRILTIARVLGISAAHLMPGGPRPPTE